MKYTIEYYYDIIITNIIKNSDNYFIKCNKDNYCFYKLDNVEKLSYSLKLLGGIVNNLYFGSYLKNNKGELITYVSNDKYILIKYNYHNSSIVFQNIIDFKKKIYINDYIYNLSKYRWNVMWKKKLDFFEDYMNNSSCFSSDIKALMNYFIFLGENAIQYYEKINNSENNIKNFEKLTITHRRISVDSTFFELYNPLNLIVDHESRDIAEYMKSKFIHTKNISSCDEIIKNARLSSYGYRILYSRLLFPTFFFDLFNSEKSLAMQNNVVELYNFTDKYELFLRHVYVEIRNNVFIPEIKWIK